MISALLFVGIGLADPTVPAIDYQKVADKTEWRWKDDEATPWHSFGKAPIEYDLRLEQTSKKLYTVTITFGKDGKTLYSFDGHRNSVFRIVGNVLYYPQFHPSSSGAALVAVDLSTGKELWKTDLKGVGPVSHFKYRNLINMELSNETATVFGNESYGRYVEIVDLSTGKTVGHKKFQKDDTPDK
jgi:outer membrane protein assembly factor BamB